MTITVAVTNRLFFSESAVRIFVQRELKMIKQKTIKCAKGEPEKVIVLPEGQNQTIKQAAELIESQACARTIPLTPQRIAESGKLEEFAKSYYELVGKKDKITLKQARRLVEDPFYFATMMVRLGYAHCVIGGLSLPSRMILRIFLKVIGVKEKGGVVSEIGFVEQANDIIAFADVAVNPSPTPAQLAHITRDSCRTYQILTRRQPRAALVSYSTGDSGKGRSVDKIKEAFGIFQQKYASPDWMVFGPCQVDAALNPEVARVKGSPFTRKSANILIGGSLDVANSLYKLAENLWERQAGHELKKVLLSQGLKYPAVDLSRGDKVLDITNTAAALSLIAEQREIDPYFLS